MFKGYYVPRLAKGKDHYRINLPQSVYNTRFEHEMKYAGVLGKIFSTGEDHIVDRTGKGRRKIFGQQLRFNCSTFLPMVTQRRVPFRSIVEEQLWILSGSSNINDMTGDIGRAIWGEWADESGYVGPMYGASLRSFIAARTDGSLVTIDQLDRAIHKLKTNPESTRIRLTTMNLGVEPDESISARDNVKAGNAALTPCHGLVIHLHVLNPAPGQTKRRLSMDMYQASCDFAVGGAFNMTSYALLLRMIAQCVDMQAHEFIWTIGDAHIYLNQIETITRQLELPIYHSPLLEMNPDVTNLFDFKVEDFSLDDYESGPIIRHPVAV